MAWQQDLAESQRNRSAARFGPHAMNALTPSPHAAPAFAPGEDAPAQSGSIFGVVDAMEAPVADHAATASAKAAAVPKGPANPSMMRAQFGIPSTPQLTNGPGMSERTLRMLQQQQAMQNKPGGPKPSELGMG